MSKKIDFDLSKISIDELRKAYVDYSLFTEGTKYMKATKKPNEYPVRTKFPSLSGGHWEKIGNNHFKWCTGDIFPNVGADWNGCVILPKQAHFITPCFIKNSRSLWDDLDELGYERDKIHCFDDEDYLYVKDYYYGTENEISELPFVCQLIHCQNEKQFLALAAMREDSDYKQYFINDSEHQLVNQGLYFPKGSLTFSYLDKMTKDKWFPMHKANLNELFNLLAEDKFGD